MRTYIVTIGFGNLGNPGECEIEVQARNAAEARAIAQDRIDAEDSFDHGQILYVDLWQSEKDRLEAFDAREAQAALLRPCCNRKEKDCDCDPKTQGKSW